MHDSTFGQRGLYLYRAAKYLKYIAAFLLNNERGSGFDPDTWTQLFKIKVDDFHFFTESRNKYSLKLNEIIIAQTLYIYVSPNCLG